jgi:hypothetical protein
MSDNTESREIEYKVFASECHEEGKTVSARSVLRELHDLMCMCNSYPERCDTAGVKEACIEVAEQLLQSGRAELDFEDGWIKIERQHRPDSGVPEGQEKPRRCNSCGAWICRSCGSCSSDCGCAKPDIPCDCWFKHQQVCDICQGVSHQEPSAAETGKVELSSLKEFDGLIDQICDESIREDQPHLPTKAVRMYRDAIAQRDAAIERLRSVRTSIAYAHQPDNCGDHCRNNCRDCVLRRAIEDIDETLKPAAADKAESTMELDFTERELCI